MKRNMYFCDGWFKTQKCAPNLITSEQAEKLHNKGKAYTVLIDSSDRPFCAIDIIKNKQFITVVFFLMKTNENTWNINLMK